MRLLPILATSLVLLSAPALLAQSTDFPALDACSKAIAANKDGAKQVELCRAAVEDASGHTPADKILAYEYTATAYRRNRQGDHAIGSANHAVMIVNKVHADDTTAAGAYLVLAQCYEIHKDELQAEDAAHTAVDDQRKAYQAASPENQPAAATTLKAMLRYRARLLKDLHRDGDSIGCLEEASKL